MHRNLIHVLAFLCASLLTAQNITISKEFPALKTHVPIKIMDEDEQTFCVLRYNKKIHDFTFERREKNTGQITLFISLQLDSVNANWFDYENLTYLAFVHQHCFYFLFEKAINKKKSLFLKSIDSNGNVSSFSELASIEKEGDDKEISLVFSRTENNKLLLVVEHYNQNATAKKMVMLFDLSKCRRDYTIKLPMENQSTGYSGNYVCTENKVFYVMGVLSPNGYRKTYNISGEVPSPIYETKILSLNYLDLETQEMGKTHVCMEDKTEIKSLTLVPNQKGVLLSVMYVANRSSEAKTLAFKNQLFDKRLTQSIYCRQQLMDSVLAEQLTFYDGSERNQASDKEYRFYKSICYANEVYHLVERQHDFMYNELVLWHSNVMTGAIVEQKIIPRKIYYPPRQTRYKHWQEVNVVIKDSALCLFLMEEKGNAKITRNDFDFSSTKMLEHLWDAQLMQYSLSKKTGYQKKSLYKNGAFEAVQMDFEGNKGAYIFYLHKKGKEKFAISTL